MSRLTKRYAPGGALKSGFVFALMACFALMALLIVLLGVKVYRSVDDASTLNNESRTGLSYVAGKIRAFDEAGMIGIRPGEDGNDVLVLGSVFGGVRYDTYIYYYDGSLCECFARADRGLHTDLGDSLVAVGGFSASLTGNLLTVTVTDQNGTRHPLTLLLRTQPGGGAS